MNMRFCRWARISSTSKMPLKLNSILWLCFTNWKDWPSPKNMPMKSISTLLSAGTWRSARRIAVPARTMNRSMTKSSLPSCFHVDSRLSNSLWDSALGPLPATNPLILSLTWKDYHIKLITRPRSRYSKRNSKIESRAFLKKTPNPVGLSYSKVFLIISTVTVRTKLCSFS